MTVKRKEIFLVACLLALIYGAGLGLVSYQFPRIFGIPPDIKNITACVSKSAFDSVCMYLHMYN